MLRFNPFRLFQAQAPRRARRLAIWTAMALWAAPAAAQTASPADAVTPDAATRSAAKAACRQAGLDVVILGSGGPELSGSRASSGYLVREHGKARVLIDLGAGAAQNFARAGGRIEDLHALLFTHFHIDHVNDLPALAKAAWFSGRRSDLPLFGPGGSATIPDTPQFLQRQLGPQGAYPYMSDLLSGEAGFAIRPVAVATDATPKARPFSTQVSGFTLKAVPVAHGPMPALAWRVEKAGCALVLSGDTSNAGRTLDALAQGADLLIAHNAVPEDSDDEVALRLHMRPSEIGRIAADAGVRSLALSHFMRRTDGVHAQTAAAIRQRYRGPLAFVRDCEVYALPDGQRSGQCPAPATPSP